MTHRTLYAALLLLAPAAASAQSGATATAAAPTAREADRKAVERVALDYIEGFYEGDSVKLARSVRPEVTKFGFFHRRGETAWTGEAMPYAEFFSYARNIRTNNRQAPATAPKKVEVLDLLDQTAAVKITAFWGTDYMHLAKYDGRWMIVHVLWQTPVAPAARASQ